MYPQWNRIQLLYRSQEKEEEKNPDLMAPITPIWFSVFFAKSDPLDLGALYLGIFEFGFQKAAFLGALVVFGRGGTWARAAASLMGRVGGDYPPNA